ncbi:MAG: choice-of-anchor J domain-containing protein [Cyclobacteriaceae bacterium]
MFRTVSAITILILLGIAASAQDKCGTYQLQQKQLGENLYRQNEKVFENWLLQKQNDRAGQLRQEGAQQEILKIPVVVHVLHQGEAIGVASNIPEGQIISQIQILNQDFRRQNPDAANTRELFNPVAADVNIEFELAKQDPEGLPTTGIVRVKAKRSNYSINDDIEIKENSFWPTEDYLNIWVVDLSNDLLGFAQFPVSNLQGLTVDRTNNRLTDGIVVDYEYFGRGFNTDSFSEGRTATHEIGHFLGLRHIWGDGGCNVDDFCEDTPQMGDNSSGCPNAPESCGSVDMFENYMDFTDDDCMNLFTSCQAMRMRTVLQESPRRRSLLTSKALVEPILAANDIGIRQIVSPELNVCSEILIPEIEVRNTGNNIVNTYTITLSIDGLFIESVKSTETLNSLETSLVKFGPITTVQGEEHVFQFEVTKANGVDDGNSNNNIRELLVQYPFQSDLPINGDFENGQDMWMTRNFDGSSSNFTISNAPRIEPGNKAYSLPIQSSSAEEFGDLEMLLSPIIDLDKVGSVEMNFRYAYAPVTDNIIDGLTVGVLTECGNFFDVDNLLSFERYGNSLGTTTEKEGAFIPAGEAEWASATLTLNKFINQNDLQVAFIAQNGGGNNIYIDDIEIVAASQFKLDAKVTTIKELPLITCRDILTPIVEVKNFGTDTIRSLDYSFTDGFNNFESRLEGIVLDPGEAQAISVGIPNLVQGEFEFEFTVDLVNDRADDDPTDNSIKKTYRVTEQSELAPSRERFDELGFESSKWFPFSKTGEHNWSFFSVAEGRERNYFVTINAFRLNEIGTQNWLVSPRLDLSQSAEASMSFDISYAQRSNISDQLQVVVSTDCGRNFNHVVYDKKGSELGVTTTDFEWFPQSEDDWRTDTIDLSEFAGDGMDDVLVAFVFTNANGNALYIDNINFFVTATPGAVRLGDDKVKIFPNPATTSFNITFNLEEKETVTVRLVDLMGKELIKEDLPNILNQTFSFDTFNLRAGMYLVQSIGETFSKTERIIVID